jgi:glucokinase
MKILDRIQFSTETIRGPEFAINNLLKHASTIVGKISGYTLAAIGISCGGPLNTKKGFILSPPNLPGWDNIHITKIVQDELNAPAFLQNDANACALAEWHYGAGKGTNNMVFLTFGTGMGAGLILNGKLYTGTNDSAGEIGHVRLAKNGPIGYNKNGSFEGFCSGAGIKRLAENIISEKMDNGKKVSFIKNRDELQKLTAKELAEAANAGDGTALKIFQISAKYLGMGISILIDIINPERIVVGSIFYRYPDLFKSICNDIIKKEALESAANACEIVPSALGESIGDYASLSVALNGKQLQEL